MNYLLEINTPLDQFEIRDYIIIDAPILGNAHISLTNIGLYITISFFILIILLGITNKIPKFIYSS
jgi:F-type H+-transporting ATPase subunit a